MLKHLLNSRLFIIFLIFLQATAFISGLFFLFVMGLYELVDQIFIMGLFYSLSLFLIGLIFSSTVSLILLMFTIKYKNLGFLKFPKILRTLLSLYIFVAILVVSLFCIAIYGAFTEDQHAPQIFSLSDPKAKYVVTKNGNFYNLRYNSTSDKNKSYSCSWEGNQKTCQWLLNNNMQAFIASSKESLEPFVNKSVKLKGEFIYSNKQCIQDNCQDLGNSVAVRIDSIKLNE